MVGGRHLSPGRAQGFESGILNPALFGTTHTCSHLALGSRIVSSHDVMGFEVRQSEIQSIRLDFFENPRARGAHASAGSIIDHAVIVFLLLCNGITFTLSQSRSVHFFSLSPEV